MQMRRILWCLHDYTFFDFETWEFHWNAKLDRHFERLVHRNPVIDFESLLTESATTHALEQGLSKWIRARSEDLCRFEGVEDVVRGDQWELNFVVMFGLSCVATLEFSEERESGLSVGGRSVDEASFSKALACFVEGLVCDEGQLR